MKTQQQSGSIESLAPHDQPVLSKSIWQIINTLGPIALLWYAAYWSLSVHYGLTLLFSVITGALLVRNFIIFHDCCHRSFFKNRRANEIIGYITGVLTFTPYEQWRFTHVTHHATSGNLDKRGTGDIWTLTVREYCELPRKQRFLYRLYRNPFVMFIIGPIYIFGIDYRTNRPDAPMKERINTHLTNLGIAAICGGLIAAVGWQAFLLVHVPVFMVSGILGIWMFYVQHQFEESYYESDSSWNYVDAALKGSSYFHLPQILHWFTGNIGFHHIHHLNPRVPNYFLQTVFAKHAKFRAVPTITIMSSFATMRLRLWDEQAKQMVGWKEMRTWRRQQPAYQKKMAS
jgi:omega-6 fatty acid desaturase (delta-12 desaturase)